MSKPPKTQRFCLICDKITKFSYDRNVGHSYCEACGTQSSIGVNPNNHLLKHFQKKIKELKKEFREKELTQNSELNRLRKTIKFQKKIINKLEEKIKIMTEVK